MNIRMIYRLLLAVLACAFFVSNAYAIDKVLVRVGDVPITYFEISREYQKLIPVSGSYHGGVDKEKLGEIWNTAQDNLIERAYMVQYALDEKLKVRSGEIDKIIDPVLKKYSSTEELEKALQGETVSELREAVSRKLLADKALQKAVSDRVAVTDKQIRAFYDENKKRYMRPHQYRASHILIKVDPSSSEEVKIERMQHAKTLAAKAKAGEDFYNLAYYNSDDRTKYVGGDMGYFHQGQIMAELDGAIQKMTVGEISEPIRTLYGYSVLKLVESNPPRQLSFDDVKDNLRKQLQEKQYGQIRSEWLAGLKAKYKVRPGSK